MKTDHPSSTSMSLHLLGSFALNAQEERPLPELRRKTRALLAYLVAAQRPYSRQELAALFCQEANDPIRALRRMLSRLRQNEQFDWYADKEISIKI